MICQIWNRKPADLANGDKAEDKTQNRNGNHRMNRLSHAPPRPAGRALYGIPFISVKLLKIWEIRGDFRERTGERRNTGKAEGLVEKPGTLPREKPGHFPGKNRDTSRGKPGHFPGEKTGTLPRGKTGTLPVFFFGKIREVSLVFP
jgi:hypothetical protein